MASAAGSAPGATAGTQAVNMTPAAVVAEMLRKSRREYLDFIIV
jgi:hypothetical protein